VLEASSILNLILELALSGYRLVEGWQQVTSTTNSSSPRELLLSFRQAVRHWEDGRPSISTSIPGNIKLIRLKQGILGLSSNEGGQRDRYCLRFYRLGEFETSLASTQTPRPWLEYPLERPFNYVWNVDLGLLVLHCYEEA
jgi:hypothetical protein